MEGAVSRCLAAALPCPGPSTATGELSLCLENILLFGHSAKSLSSLSLFPDFSSAHLYRHYQFEEVTGISLLMNSYMAQHQLPELPAPVLTEL